MRSITEHLAEVLALAVPRSATPVLATEALGRVLAVDAVATLPVPPFSNSAMDGFLVHSADVPAGEEPWTVPVVGDVPAGSGPVTVPPGHAVRIMTGAPIGRDHTGLRVIPVEDTDIPPGPVPLPTEITIERVQEHRTHIRLQGENTQPGDTIIPAGALIDAGAIAAAVSCGITHLSVYPAPRVAVLSTGDELVPPGVTPGPGQLPDSNLPMVEALVATCGITATAVHAGDGDEATARILDELCATHDLVITTGGISAGAFDVVRAVTTGEGMWFGHVAQRPGASQGLGRRGEAVLLCLPGNPVAAYVSFWLYFPPLLSALAGAATSTDIWTRPHVIARVADGVTLPSSPDRAFLAPVRLTYDRDGVVAAPFNRRATGSHLVGSLATTNGLAVVEPGAEKPTPGSSIRVLLLGA
ncbi:molybdopterin molybdotransferase MoeA [Corynebacterium testudinoris]|uniref:Molybdopterin molybdenumtransferase n=1 Tax=Corynebacterium testudinoris TaxID=136857 RepID=A0A0G3H513_9CORY|nr:gephyrin-like molybdotransferase Glp [Corynebacterium testudinoris]AKK08504.1 molybdopterin molybdochelatase [Corynebacterium testudinoris]